MSKEIGDWTVTLIAPSKTFNIAGLECSVIICQNEEFRQKLEKARRGLLGHVNLLGLVAGTSAYSEGDPWLSELMVTLEGNRDFLVKFIRERMPEITLYAPEGTYLAWLDCRSLAIQGDACEFFIKKARVALNPGKSLALRAKAFCALISDVRVRWCKKRWKGWSEHSIRKKTELFHNSSVSKFGRFRLLMPPQLHRRPVDPWDPFRPKIQPSGPL